jgi:hypothetical protein
VSAPARGERHSVEELAAIALDQHGPVIRQHQVVDIHGCVLLTVNVHEDEVATIALARKTDDEHARAAYWEAVRGRADT